MKDAAGKVGLIRVGEFNKALLERSEALDMIMPA